MKTAVISIGRKIGYTDMDYLAWDEFKGTTLATCRKHGTELGVAEGHGYWTDADGETIGEQTYWVMVSTSRGQLKELRRKLAQVAGRFGQDAIGLTVTDSSRSLVAAEAPALLEVAA